MIRKSAAVFCLRVFLLVGLFMVHLRSSFAQDTNLDKGQHPLELRQAVGVILLSGLVGGVLGLSTLSFYSEPQDHIRNITFGAGAGIIVSAFYLTFSAAQQPLPADAGGSSSAQYYYLPDPPRFQLTPVVKPDQIGVLAQLKF